MKRTAVLSTALCLALIASGCAYNQSVSAGESSVETSLETTVVETTEVVTSETQTETTSEETVWTFKSSHDVRVETVTLQRLDDGNYTFATLVPKIFVDGKEASEINSFLNEYIQKNYPLRIEDNYADGMSETFDCGVKDNILSIHISASATDCDYFTGEVLNFDLDTLKQLENSEVTKLLGMTDDAFLSKATDIVKAACKDSGYDLDKSVALVKYDKVTAFIQPDGTIGVAATLVYSDQTQFVGMECVRCFNIEKV